MIYIKMTKHDALNLIAAYATDLTASDIELMSHSVVDMTAYVKTIMMRHVLSRAFKRANVDVTIFDDDMS